MIQYLKVMKMIKSVQKATMLLSILADQYEQPVSLAELSERSGLNKSTCSHIMSTLENEGFAVKISHTRGYVLGPAAYCLSRFGRYKNSFISVCRPIMQYLHRNSGYSVVLAVIEGDTKYIIDYIDDGTIFETKTKIRKDDIYRTATGRAILMNLSEEQRNAIFKKYGKPSQSEWPEILHLLDVSSYTQQKCDDVFKSCIVTNEDNTVNLGYGTALFSGHSCVGAIGIAVNIPCEREKSFGEEENKIIKLIERGAKEINRRLEW